MPDPFAPESSTSTTPDRDASARILARAFYKELRSNGYTSKHLLAVSSELIGLITSELQKDREDLSRAA